MEFRVSGAASQFFWINWLENCIHEIENIYAHHLSVCASQLYPDR